MKLFKRSCRVVVGLTAGATEALEFTDFRITFKVNQALTGTPASAEIYIYNLSIETMARFSGEGQSIALYAGYGDQAGLIFQGQVFQLRRGRESPVDTWLCILAQNADVAHNFAVVTGTLAKGWTMQDLRDKTMKAMTDKGAEQGYQAPLPPTKFPRARVLYGMARDYLTQIARSTNQEWGYDGNSVIMVNRNQPANAVAFVLNTQTGMIGMPQLTSEGLRVSSLLNPLLKMGGQVQVDEGGIQSPLFDVTVANQPNNIYIDKKFALGAKGFYNIIGVSHSGDTRGDAWQTDVIGWGVSAIPPKSGVMINGAPNSV